MRCVVLGIKEKGGDSVASQRLRSFKLNLLILAYSCGGSKRNDDFRIL